jgi:NAD(P)-dependent dehydrogenase (short-subunit alcohol dehydrogenase family)
LTRAVDLRERGLSARLAAQQPTTDWRTDLDETVALKGRVALVTGGASGLGRATARVLAAAGAHVAIGDVNAAGSEETLRQVTDAGGSAEVVALDVTDDGQRRSVVGDLFDRHGDSFDVLVNVAGIDRPGYVTDIDLDDYRRVQAVNCEGPIFLTSEFMKRVQHLPEGRTADVVHVVSLSAITSGSGAIAYNGSKAGFLNATRCIQRELREKATTADDGTERPFPCRVQSVIPAAMDTPMMEQWGIPSHLMMPPDAVAEMVRTLLLLHPASFVPEMQIVPRLEPNFPR